MLPHPVYPDPIKGAQASVQGFSNDDFVSS